MKKIVTTLFLLIPTLLFGQSSKSSRIQEIERFRIAYLSQKLGLSSAEAKIFWPIFNQWQRERNTLRKQRAETIISFKKTTEIEDLADNEIQSLIVNDFNIRQKELNLDKKYYQKLKSNLSLKIVGKFYRAQETFKKEILSRYRNSRPMPQRHQNK